MINRLSLQATGKILLSLLAASALVTAGCSSDTQSGGTGTGGSSQTTSSQSSSGAGGSSATSTGSAGTGGGQASSSVALLNSKITKVTDADKNLWLDAGEKLDPTTLIVVVSTEAESCAAPVFDFGTTSHHLVLVGLPQAMQKVGTYDLATTEVIAYGTTWLGDGMGSGGGGKMVLNKGTVEVVSLDATTITVRLAGLTGEFLPQNGDHAATRCP